MTSDEINALPERVRRYIHDLETRCDPAGEVRALWQAREQVAQLTALIGEARALAWSEGYAAGGCIEHAEYPANPYRDDVSDHDCKPGCKECDAWTYRGTPAQAAGHNERGECVFCGDPKCGNGCRT